MTFIDAVLETSDSVLIFEFKLVKLKIYGRPSSPIISHCFCIKSEFDYISVTDRFGSFRIEIYIYIFFEETLSWFN